MVSIVLIAVSNALMNWMSMERRL